MATNTGQRSQDHLHPCGSKAREDLRRQAALYPSQNRQAAWQTHQAEEERSHPTVQQAMASPTSSMGTPTEWLCMHSLWNTDAPRPNSTDPEDRRSQKTDWQSHAPNFKLIRHVPAQDLRPLRLTRNSPESKPSGTSYKHKQVKIRPLTDTALKRPKAI